MIFGKRKNKNKNIQGIELEDYLISVSEEESSRIEIPLEKRKMKGFWIIILVFGHPWLPCFYLGVIKGSY